MTEESPEPHRKRLRIGHVSERGGINAVRSLLERHGLVVAEVDGRSDYGRDLMVDITENDEITGTVIGIQVKGDRRYIHDETWAMVPTSKDLRYWADSSVPVAGVLWDPDSGEMRWANLTAHARKDPTISTWPPSNAAAERLHEVVQFDSTVALNNDSLAVMVDQMRTYVRQTATPALLGLFDKDDERRCLAVFDCWTLGRSDAKAFLLLRYALPSLSGRSIYRAIVTLSHLTPHPDIFWHAENWIPPEIEREVQSAFRWTADEIYHLIQAVEHADEEGSIWERGGLGQCLWMLLSRDPGLQLIVLPAIGIAASKDDVESAFRLLLIHQYLATDPFAAAEDAILRFPILRWHFATDGLLQELARSGRLGLF